MGLPLNRIESYLGARASGPAWKPGSQSAVFVIDSRKVKRGDVFVAIKGENHDAHSFIDKALMRKASLIIVNKEWYRKKQPASGRFLAVKDTVEAMLKMAECWRRDLKVKIVAVTGSNGKTTTRAMIGRVLSKKYRVFESGGNFNNRIGMPLSVFRISRRHDIAVLEMGTNHFGEIDELSRAVHPDMAVVTNVGRCHLEFLKNKRGVLKAKMEILNGMGPGGILVVNNDDPLLRAFRPRKGLRRIRAGFSGKIGLRGARLKTGLLSGTSFKVDGRVTVKLRIPGLGAAQDALLAMAVGKAFGVSVAASAGALRETKVPSDRMEIREKGGVTWIADCYNANPDSLNNVLLLLKQEKAAGRKVAVLGNMGELGRESAQFHREAGSRVKQCGFDVLFTLGDLGREIAAGARKSGLVNCHSFDKREDIAEVLRCTTRRGDMVLIKGSHSMRMEEIAHKFI
jgi:UDP-N-acetylmuramoyl-tripeptide--D-alanyl-D-alanine ligase